MSTILALVLSPVMAVLISVGITIWYQNRKQKLDAKHQLFRTLMAHRKASPPPFELVNSLNLIDVIFADNHQVVVLWHNYYNSLHQKEVNWPNAQHQYLDLLSEIAKSLDYKSLSQTDIDKFYTPVAHGEMAEVNWKIQKELLRVLENTARFVVERKDDAEISS
jgi:hypothetical protein